jgi:hypothetical protein
MKNYFLKLAAFALLMAGTMFACGKEEDKNIVETTNFAVPQGCGWMYGFFTDLSPHHKHLVIKSQEELEKELACDACDCDIPRVDFEKYSMLVFICDYGTKITHELQQKNKYEYAWNIDIEGIKKGGDLILSVLTPKLPSDAQVRVNVKYNPN